MKKPLVSIVTPTYNRQKQILRLLQSLKETDYPLESLDVIIVDNASDPDLQRSITETFPDANVIAPGRNLYSNGARKLGAASARGKYVFFLDDDNVLENGCIALLVDALEHNASLGMVGPVMLDSDSDTIWSAGARLTKLGMCDHLYGGSTLSQTSLPKIIYGIDYFPNAAIVRKSVLLQVPLDDESFPHNWAEIDFGLRVLAAGYELACIPQAVERHYIGYTGRLTRFKAETIYDQAKSRILFRKRHLYRVFDWLVFCFLIFPASSVVYLQKIILSSDQKLRMIGSYIRGTCAGIFSSTERVFKPLTRIEEEQ